MKKNFAKRLFSSCKTTIPQLCNAWQIADKYQPLLGPRTVIISSNDKLSKELSQRMWYEMQRVGIQSAFITLNTPYPVLNAIQESLSLFRRTGAKSIITIGNGAIADYGKALRSCAETALMPHQLMKSKMYTQRETIPLFCVRTSLSKVPFTSTLQVLHPEDDVLISAEGRAPEVVAFDSTLNSLVPYERPIISKSYILGSIMDSLFSLAFHHALKNPDIDRKALNHFLFHHIAVFDAKKTFETHLNLSTWDTNDPYGACSVATRSIAKFQEYVMNVIQSHPNTWPGLIEISSMLAALNPQQLTSLPYSFHAARAFKAVIGKVLLNPAEYYRSHDLLMIASLQAAMDCLINLTTIGTDDELLKLVISGEESVKDICKSHPKLFAKPYTTDNIEALTPAGHLEKLLIILDGELEQNGQISGSELRKSVLQSDIMVDIMNYVIS